MSEEKLGQHYLAALNEAFPGVVLDHAWQTKDQLTVTVKVNYLPEVVEFLYYKQGGWLSVLFGNDERKLNGHYAVYYVLSMEKGTKCWVTVRVEVDANKPEYPSVTPRVPAAVWGEREVRDMYGLIPVGLPDERRLVLPDDWPDELYPLRKDSMDYRQRPAPTTDAETYEFINELGDKKNNVVPIGPLHVTSDEPGHFRLFVDGENIIDADYRLFYVHRGMEKLAETRMGYNEVTFLSDRVCGICGFAHSTAYTTSVENAMGIQVPERAQMIRAILLEVERLHSHLLNLGLACHFTGFDSGFMQFFRVRETSMKMAEILTGARKTYGLNLIGGIRRDLLKDDMIQTRQLAQQMRREVQELVDVLLSTPNMEQRTVGIGRLDPEIARDFSNVGPMVRASGHARDTRADHPFVGYGLLPMEVHSEQGCDVISRLKVRINEVYTALNMIDYGLDENGYWSGIRALDYVTLPEDYASIPLKKADIEPTEEDVQSQIDSLLSQNTTTQQITDRAAADGDTVNIDYVGTVDGVAFTGGTYSGYSLTLGSGSFIDGFEDQIVGHKPGETFEVNVTFPDGYSDSTDAEGNTVVLSNKKAVFSVTLNYISEEILPELTDAWVEENFSSTDGVHTVEDLRAEYQKMLYQNNLNTAVMDYLLANSTFKDLPKEVTDYQVNQCLNYYYTMAQYYGYDLDSFLQAAAGYNSADDLLDAMSDSITEYAREALLYQAVAEAMDIAPTQEQIDTYSAYTETYGANYCTMVALMDAVSEVLTTGAQVK